jgi:succinate-acetate transporter protein
MLSLEWHFSAVVLLNSLLGCGSLPLATPLVQLASRFHHLFVAYFIITLRFSDTAFTSYGAFWLSFATLLIPSSGIADAYAASKNPAQEVDAIAIYLTAWMVVTFLFLLVPYSFLSCSRRTDPPVFVFHSIGSLRKSIGLTALFFLLTLTFMLLAVCEYRLSILQ